MKKILAGTAAAFTAAMLGGAAFAQDNSHDWTGPYVGVHGGFGKSDVFGLYDRRDARRNDLFIDDGAGYFEMAPKDFVGGAQIGYNLQSGHFVLGAEADMSHADWYQELRYASEDELLSVEMDWMATARARAGYTIDNLLLYTTGGLAWTNMRYTATDDFRRTSRRETGIVDFDKMGLALGGGTEYAINDRFSLKADALLISFDDIINTARLQADERRRGDFVEFDDMFLARVGINYHF
jgi:outer membrane immunogenic protein